jgi:hypothetical protein
MRDRRELIAGAATRQTRACDWGLWVNRGAGRLEATSGRFEADWPTGC